MLWGDISKCIINHPFNKFKNKKIFVTFFSTTKKKIAIAILNKLHLGSMGLNSLMYVKCLI
jgi:hypothetical protein